MKHKKTAVIMGILILATLADIITTLMVYAKQPYFNETNPIYLMTNSLLLMFLYKIIIVGIISIFFINFYDRPPIYVRYFTVVYLVLVIFGQFNAAMGNINEFQKEPMGVKDIPAEARLEYYEAKYSNVRLIPLPIYIFQLFIYLVIWLQIEKEQISNSSLP